MNNNASANRPRGNTLTPVRAGVVLIVLCGGIYPAVTALIGGTLFPYQSTGSVIEVDGEAVGSELVGQPFVGERYFYGRHRPPTAIRLR
jgi:K+-transporting ATPase ATPase C chain